MGECIEAKTQRSEADGARTAGEVQGSGLAGHVSLRCTLHIAGSHSRVTQAHGKEAELIERMACQEAGYGWPQKHVPASLAAVGSACGQHEQSCWPGAPVATRKREFP